jgi:RNA 3'-terminal phosphate cyclase
MAIAGGGKFRTMPLSQHTLTQISLVERVLGARISTTTADDGAVTVAIAR